MENKKQTGGFIDSLESLSDSIINPIYSESFMKNIETNSFVKSLVDSAFINALQNFGKGWFKGVFVFFGWLAIIFGILGLIFWIIGLFNGISSYEIFSIISTFITVLAGVGIVRFKKWYPFIVCLSFIFSIIYIIQSNYIFYGPIKYFNTSGMIISSIISVLFFIIGFALIVKNKELFKN